MYFDHVRCPSCGAQFDPEAIDSSGGVAACPACKSQLDIKSLFGVAAQFEDADAPSAGIDDLVAGYGNSGDAWRTTSGYDPLADGAPPPSSARGRGAPPPAHSTSMVQRVKGEPAEDETEESGPSAVLRALRDLKKR